MRIHLGHHFYGAGNLGDDFMLAGFFAAMRTLAPRAAFTCCVPFALEPLRARFPQVVWLPYEPAAREHSIAACDAWLGLGGSPFQHALSRWFLDHLLGDAAICARHNKPMFYLGVGVQSRDELAAPDVRRLCAQAARIWTRDTASAEGIAALPSPPPVDSAADLAHLYFRESAPPRAAAGRVTLVPNFDYGAWPGEAALLDAVDGVSPRERVWLAQEARELPGAERALHAALPPAAHARWRLVVPDADDETLKVGRDLPSLPVGLRGGTCGRAHRSLGEGSRARPRYEREQTAPGDRRPPAQTTSTSKFPLDGMDPAQRFSLDNALSRWPSGEWLVTARYHAALAGAWAGSKIIVIATNEKLRAAARELGCPAVSADADVSTVARALATAEPALPPAAQAELAFSACKGFCLTVPA